MRHLLLLTLFFLATARMDYARMLRRWAEVYQSDGLTAKAIELNTKADALYKE